MIFFFVCLLLFFSGYEQPWLSSVAGSKQQSETWLKPKRLSEACGRAAQQEVLIFHAALYVAVTVPPHPYSCLSNVIIPLHQEQRSSHNVCCCQFLPTTKMSVYGIHTLWYCLNITYWFFLLSSLSFSYYYATVWCL